MGGYFWQEAVSSPNSLVGLEAHVFAVVTAPPPGLDVQDGSQMHGSRVRSEKRERNVKDASNNSYTRRKFGGQSVIWRARCFVTFTVIARR